MRRSASLDSFCCDARSSTARTFSRIWNSKSLSSEASFDLQLAHAIAHFNIALAFQPFAFHVQRILLLACRLALHFELGKLAVQFVEEARDIGLLRSDPFPCRGDNRCVQSQALCRLNSGRCARHAKMKLIIGHKRPLIHACCGIAHARRVGRVNLERGVMRRDQRPRSGLEKMMRHGDGESRAFFGIGR